MTKQIFGKILLVLLCFVSLNASNSDDEFIFNLNIEKKELNVGESARLTLSFKRKIDSKIDKIIPPDIKIDNFWIKSIDGSKNYTKDGYVFKEISYIIFPQKAGDFHIKPFLAQIGRQYKTKNNFFDDPFFDSFNVQIKWAKIQSNPLDIKVKALPNNLELFGDFKIKATIDKKENLANKPINLTIDIQGVGNIDDIKKFDIKIPQAVVYSDEPKIVSSLKNNNYGGVFTQKIAIIANKDFTIPKLNLQYFDKITKTIKTISTKPIDIKIKNAQTQQPKIEKKQQKIILPTQSKISQNSQNRSLKYIFFIVGVVFGFAIAYMIFRKKPTPKKKQNHITKMIQDAKDDKQLFDILLPYTNFDKQISNILKQLEDNIYKKSNNKIDKQKLYDIFLD
jgi:hypothetical protein